MKAQHEHDTVPEKTRDYLIPSYWDKRFEEEASYEWCKDYGAFKHLLQPQLKPTDRMLVLGCGNSSLSADLWRDGYKDITSIDLSQVVIEKMEAKAKAAGMHSLQWQAADMLDLPFEDQSFDLVLEKGTLDCLFVDNESPWNPKPEVCDRMHKALLGIHRVLRCQGIFISVTFAQPHFRKPFLMARDLNWGVEHFCFGESFHFFVYIAKKGQRPACEPKCMEYNPSVHLTAEGTTHDHMEQEDYLMQMDLA